MLIRVMDRPDGAAVAALNADLGYPTTSADVGRRLDRPRDWPDTGLFVAEDAQVIVS